MLATSTSPLTIPLLFVHPPGQGQIGGETFVEYEVPVPLTSVLRFSVGVTDNASCTECEEPGASTAIRPSLGTSG